MVFYPAGSSNSDYSYYLAHHINYAYDSNPVSLPANPTGGYTYGVGGLTMLGRACFASGCTYHHPNIWYEVATSHPLMDMLEGWSGSGMICTVHKDQNDPTFYTAGVWGHGDGVTFNSARKLDFDFWSFVGAVTSQW